MYSVKKPIATAQRTITINCKINIMKSKIQYNEMSALSTYKTERPIFSNVSVFIQHRIGRSDQSFS